MSSVPITPRSSNTSVGFFCWSFLVDFLNTKSTGGVPSNFKLHSVGVAALSGAHVGQPVSELEFPPEVSNGRRVLSLDSSVSSSNFTSPLSLFHINIPVPTKSYLQSLPTYSGDGGPSSVVRLSPSFS